MSKTTSRPADPGPRGAAARRHDGTDAERFFSGRNGAHERRALLAINDPQPLGQESAIWCGVSQAATVGMFFILMIAALYFGRPVLLPIASALVIGMMLGPLSARAEQFGVPTLLTAIVLWLAVIGVFYAILILLSAPLVDWFGKGPEIARNIKEKLHILDSPLDALQELRNAIFPSSVGDSGVKLNFLTMIQPALSFVTPAIGQLIVFFGTLFFFLLGRTQMRRVLVIFFDGREARLRMLRILNDIEHSLTGYLSVVAAINMVVGVCAGGVALLVGLPDPIAWGVLGFLLNFIPYLGALIMEIILFMVGLVSFPTLGYAAIAPILYLVVTTVEGHFITPTIMGRRLTMNPLTVFLALVFWTWLWGPIGAFLAVPLLIIAMVAIHHLFPKEEPALPD